MGQTTERLYPDRVGLARATSLLRGGALVAFPTETVYGLGADARNGEAVAAIYQAKGRPSFNPLIVHVASVAAARSFGKLSPAAETLAAAFWPGPLTLVLPLVPGAGLSPLVTAGLDTVGLRVPAADVAHRLLHAFDGPVAAPSANPSGKVSPTTADHVLQGLTGRISAVLDGGPCAVGLESTIVDCSGTPTLLRPGGIPVEQIERLLGHPLAKAGDSAPVTAPGQLASHYAPAKPIRLNAMAREPGELWLGFGPQAGTADLNLSATGDLREAAAALFGALRELDSRPGTAIAVSPVPERDLGRAINDRLRRAAAPRA